LKEKRTLKMKKIVLFLSISFMAGVAFVNIYNSIVDAASWGSNVPASIETTRQYYHYTNPGVFFRTFSPINQILALLALILFWKTSKEVRIFLGAAFIIAVLSDVFTFAYFYPRNNLLFNLPITSISDLSKTVSQWQSMNWVRSALIVSGLVSSFLGLNKISSGNQHLKKEEILN
jgi:Anthrone oxygenase